MRVRSEVIALENAIASTTRAGPDLMQQFDEPLRRALAACAEITPSQSLGSILEACTVTAKDRRTAALLIVRMLAIPGLFEEHGTDPFMDRRLLGLVSAGAPDIYQRFIQNDKEQTFKKLDRLRTLHPTVISDLNVLRGMPHDPASFVGARQAILKTTNNKLARAYLQPFGGTPVIAAVESILRGVNELRDVSDRAFGDRLDHETRHVVEMASFVESNPTFLTRDYLLPFLDAAREAFTRIDKDKRGRFQCRLGPRVPGELILEKRYPLLRPDHLQSISIPLWNTGPGTAIGVVAEFAPKPGFLEFANLLVEIGDVAPGGFSVAAEFMMASPRHAATLEFTLSWGTLAGAERYSGRVFVHVSAQSPNVDWIWLQTLDPYGSTIAEGSQFYGRSEKVAALTSRLLKDRMQSSYVTGQKRIGKSSLALAVRDAVSRSDPRVSFSYLEYGEYAHRDPAETLAALGERIGEFLVAHLPEEVEPVPLKFSGTLAPLNRLADQLLRHTPAKRFVIILDEFDEIPIELYRMGPLAESFFANLRTLSGKKNVAFMLVGGENMPFIVSAQGDQLNKFVREGVDYFSRTTEWSEYLEMVSKPVAPSLKWHESAVSHLFNVTNGHPYYTKLLCARVFATGLSEKDTDFTTAEVQRAHNELASTLDTNSFAHLWRDGIQGTREEVEVVALRRCRVLVALGRLVRRGEQLTHAGVKQAKLSNALNDHEIEPVLTDLCRRGILIDNGGEYSFQVPLFRDWLAQSGINRLVADALGDHLAESAQKAEDAAFVTDGELQSVVDSWGTFKGRRYTTGDLRTWLNQVRAYREQRMLFKLLANLRFFSEQEIREKMKVAHALVLRSVPEFVRRHLADRRRDILVTYVDGPAKSGLFYATRYAEENLIAPDSVKEMRQFSAAVELHESLHSVTVNGIVIVDDIVGTGRSLGDNLKRFCDENRQMLVERSMSIVVVALCSTTEGENALRRILGDLEGLRIDFRICEPLGGAHVAFGPDVAFWSSVDEQVEARALCLKIGSEVYKPAPLGYGGQGLLVVFPNTCPNNSVALLHAGDLSGKGWRPLFPRGKN